MRLISHSWQHGLLSYWYKCLRGKKRIKEKERKGWKHKGQKKSQSTHNPPDSPIVRPGKGAHLSYHGNARFLYSLTLSNYWKKKKKEKRKDHAVSSLPHATPSRFLPNAPHPSKFKHAKICLFLLADCILLNCNFYKSTYNL